MERIQEAIEKARRERKGFVGGEFEHEKVSTSEAQNRLQNRQKKRRAASIIPKHKK